MSQSVDWKSKSVNCTIRSVSDIIYAVVLSDIFPLFRYSSLI